MARWKLILEYDGTRYSGWQEQKNARTVAGDLHAAAEKVLGGPVELDGAGRTDAGVHAIAQVARLKARRLMPVDALQRALNDELPKDINILHATEIHGEFDPRRDALRRYYLYQISTRRTAFAKKFVWWIKEPLNLEAMRAAAASLPGKHDFERFCEKRADEPSTIVTVERAEFVANGGLLLFRIAASHYLWRMVRRVVGTLVEVGRGTITPDDFGLFVTAPALPRKLRSFSIPAHTAPPSGLFLERVVYRESDEPGPPAPVIPVR
ncbi:MAG TPA: tRNA pseudouridine(38-40) synthase TruA [Acidobacteriota bacterium]|nr:tRNA pseudouridine(38-40) synthase TruA [Acidobacteriota bacterium]